MCQVSCRHKPLEQSTIFLLAFLATVVVAVPLALIGRAWSGRRAKVVDEVIEEDAPGENAQFAPEVEALAEEEARIRARVR